MGQMDERSSALPIKEIVNRVISNLSGSDGKERRLGEEDINRLWRKAAGKTAAFRSRPTSLRKGKLIVAVEDSSLLYYLTLRKKQILDSLSRELEDRVHDIQFRIGETGGKGKDEKTKKRKN